ncbi:uncharacterized protein LOC115776609 [Archocentrus centrarchus]|uniref:uncharacterized protein LOC115776426 n=1 Tax=Archocentrus centrarchus TaxID=63155 RepID=UPI0011E9FEB0|nr:uncharacterized protein LOC115776426 [Archocentrus centrarchus]XP_030579957.1 uncharacterized protein LOC115776426 [Archocentrus centrarchus]XP_030580194.1 uncharacterized protein LOC115776609 [Archocentrus centrarchus]XP_030580195.1 uncharacterized protein LOC115776609 [Archocentrus centrarchus]
MDGLDDVTVSVLNAANIDEVLIHTLSRDDLRDLFPGPENFLRRKQLWAHLHKEEDYSTLPDKAGPGEAGTRSSPKGTPPSPQTSTPLVKKTPEKTLQLPSPPEYVIYTDGELELARKHYFEMACTGREGEAAMSKELRCRLVRNTVTSMISILRASRQGEELRYPSKYDVTAMAKKLVEYYPMLQDNDLPAKYTSMYSYLQKRILNIKSPRKRQGPTPERGRSKKRRHIEFSPSDQGEDDDADSSGGSTILLPPVSSSDGDSSVNMDSLATQARHYKTLQDLYKKPKPNRDAVCQILDLEFQSRRAFIDSDVLKEEDRPTKILEAYPCFKELHNVMDELRRILDKNNNKFITEVKARWEDFCSMVQFYGLWKKVLKPPMNQNRVECNIALFRALPTLFPSPTAPPKKLGHASEALLHVLQPTEDPAIYLQRRSLFSPVLLFDGSHCIMAIGTTPITTFAEEDLRQGLLYLMAYYYTLHLTYPKCVATLLSVIQTEVLKDSIHERDTTGSYKKAMAEWKAFIQE